MPSVVVKNIKRSDAADLIRANCESQAHHEPWVHPFTDADGFENWFGRQSAEACVNLVARETLSNGVVGVVSFSQISLGGFLNAYLAYYGMVHHSGRGLMTEALQTAIGYAFEGIGLHRLEANIQPSNVSSTALIRRVGFRLEGFSPRYLKVGGEWRDHERWALLCDDASAMARGTDRELQVVD